ncbi:MAG: hypothetical protein EAZ65_07285 [Verrucomicrobia bacterium]|nr:MAG: hypothetical protein EAZ84_12905 [Verrucomicrobiota bacterium]TAE87170.1 MAG: hypothetical protein EAZ82_08910 [Verrucomicrobiota bacterium]TAF24974.1 MAG: hypothetical protein EAZ71_09135 [Verrucomicrobiota bacterium]TAF40699.1 MAG: hypothetical protein EAZ65_07285 [Verrucomicrobiota bacterium]
MTSLFLKLGVIGILATQTLYAVKFNDCYRIEDIKLPAGAPPEVGAIDIASDGTLFIVLRRGDVFRAKPTRDPAAFDWQLFASGFDNGCGLDIVSPTKIRITQMAEMTEAEDSDGDGSADRFTRFAHGWGLSGNYHETNALTRDGKGGYFIAVGTASFSGPTFKHTLGTFSDAGRRGRNYSAVKWKGWVLHSDAHGKITPWASGFRMANGIYQDPRGELWAGDNQGDWKAITPLYHVEKGKFYGHPNSLVWDPAFTKSKDPLAYYRSRLDEYNRDRTPPAVEMPHMEINRSAGEPMEIPIGSHFAGQMILPDNNGERVTRLMLEEIEGVWQGACTHLIDGRGLRSGNHRARFTADGKQLFLGQTVRGWGIPAEGLQRVTFLGPVPFDIDRIRITRDGFKVSFTHPIPDSLKDAQVWKLSSCTYQPKWTYGSEPENHREHAVRIASSDEKSLTLKVDGLASGRVFRIHFPKCDSPDGSPLQNNLAFYTVNRIPITKPD